MVGAIGLVALTAVLYWLLTDEAFTVTEERVAFDGLVHADEAEVRERLTDIERGPNVFRVQASDIVSELSTLTEVDAAAARVTLPANVSVSLDERDPVFIWSDGQHAWLVDEEGMLFAPADVVDEDADPDDDTAELDDTAVSVDQRAAEEAARAQLPRVEDARIPETPPTVGTYLKPVDLLAMRQLLALDGDTLGPRATELTLRVDDRDGYVLASADRGWRAMFGRYTRTIQPPSVVPRQAQCLEWLLASDTRKLELIRLVTTEGGCGTFTTYQEKKQKDG